jgi:hypothetical protein
MKVCNNEHIKKTEEVKVLLWLKKTMLWMYLMLSTWSLQVQQSDARKAASESWNDMPGVSKSARAFHGLKRAKRDAE